VGLFFSDDPTKQGFFAPLRFEATIRDCEVEGEIPSDISGTFYRCGVDRQYPARFQGDALFNEDGFVDMFRFGDGHVDFRSRYVRTERFLAERKARKALFGLYRNRLTNDPSVKDLSLNTANTNVIFHGGRLMALKEDSPPTEMDPNTLETKGPWRFDGKLDSLTFTAHPKIDSVTGEMLAFGYEAKGDLTDDVALYWIDKTGKVTREIWFKAPVVGMMHDMAISEDHILIPIASFGTSWERLKAGKVHWAWKPDQPIYVAVLPRDGDAKDVRWFKGPAAGFIHTLNARSEGNKVHLDAPIFPGNPFPWIENWDGSPFDPAGGGCTIRRWTFDLNSDSDTWEESFLFPNFTNGTDLIRMDDRYVSHDYRYSFLSIQDHSKPFDESRGGRLRMPPMNSYARLDHATRKIDSVFVGNTHNLSEVQFVPRKANSPEGDGYLIGVANDFASMKSELIVADATRLNEGVIARVKLPFRLHSQVHGNWVPNDVVPTGIV